MKIREVRMAHDQNKMELIIDKGSQDNENIAAIISAFEPVARMAYNRGRKRQMRIDEDEAIRYSKNKGDLLREIANLKQVIAELQNELTLVKNKAVQVGDEVESINGTIGVVTAIDSDGSWHCIQRDGTVFRVYEHGVRAWKKTGRSFPIVKYPAEDNRDERTETAEV